MWAIVVGWTMLLAAFVCSYYFIIDEVSDDPVLPALLLLRRDADATVADLETQAHRAASAFQQLDGNDDLAALGELDRVADQVGEHLAQPVRVAQHLRQRHPRRLHAQLQALALGGRGDDGQRLFQHVGHPEAERVLVLMGSGAEVAPETVEWLVARGKKVGLVKVRLFRPFPVDALIEAGVLRRLLAFTELKFSNSMIEAWWRSLKHQWLFLHSLDSVTTVRRLVEFYVHEHNHVPPHSAFRGQTPDEMYFGTGDAVPADLTSRAAAAHIPRAPSPPDRRPSPVKKWLC